MERGVLGTTVQYIPSIHSAHTAIGNHVGGISIAGVLHTEGVLSFLQFFNSGVHKGHTAFCVGCIVCSSLGHLALGVVDGSLELINACSHHTSGNQCLSVFDGSLQVGIMLVVVLEGLQISV